MDIFEANIMKPRYNLFLVNAKRLRIFLRSNAYQLDLFKTVISFRKLHCEGWIDYCQ